MTATFATLTLADVRDQSIAVERLGEMAGRSAEFAAGMVDAVEGNTYFADRIEWMEHDEMIRREYLDGFAAGEAMLDAERGIDRNTVPTWQDYPINTLPVPACEIPF